MAGKKTVSTWKLVANGSWLSGQEFPLYEEGTVLGRGKTCDITIPGTHLSRNHAELVVRDGNLVIRDLESANGTFLNNEKITESVATNGDVLRVDVYTFRVEGRSAGKDAAPTPNTASATSTRPSDSVHAAASQSLENIRNLKKSAKDYSETQWITKPTSVGNRTHNVPSNQNSHESSFWVSVVVGLLVVGALTYYFLM